MKNETIDTGRMAKKFERIQKLLRWEMLHKTRNVCVGLFTLTVMVTSIASCINAFEGPHLLTPFELAMLNALALGPMMIFCTIMFFLVQWKARKMKYGLFYMKQQSTVALFEAWLYTIISIAISWEVRRQTMSMGTTCAPVGSTAYYSFQFINWFECLVGFYVVISHCLAFYGFFTQERLKQNKKSSGSRTLIPVSPQ